MSASREKKSRQSDPTQGLTQKERKELQEQQAAKRKAVVYTVIGVIVAVLVAALLIWHSGIFQRGKTALTVGGRLLRHRCQLLFHLLYESGIQHQRRRF
jgi:hypothetical protein